MNIELLKLLCETPGVPGYEDRIRKIVAAQMKPYVDEFSVDALGNIIGIKRGKEDKKFMMAAHIDEIGFMVNHIDDEGFIRAVPLGGFDPKTLTAQRVIVHGREDIIGVMGTKPIHIMSEEERQKAPKLEDYFIDVGLPKEQVDKLIRIGDPVTRERDFVEMGNNVNCKSFDNRISVFVMIEALKKIKSHSVEVYAVASTQEEVGLRGAQVAAQSIKPDIGIGLDVTLANDVPDSKAFESVTKLGVGTAIKILDSSVVCNSRVVDFLRNLAEERSIPYQMEILPRGGTDTAAIQRYGLGAAVGCISVPTRYVHSTIEMCSKDDIQASIDLLAAFIETCHEGDFSLMPE